MQPKNKLSWLMPATTDLSLLLLQLLLSVCWVGGGGAALQVSESFMSATEDLVAVLADFEKAMAGASTARLRQLLATNIVTIKEQIRKAVAAAPIAAPAATAPVASASPTPVAQPADSALYREVKSYGFDDTDKAMKLYINLDGCGHVPDSEVELSCTEKSMMFRVRSHKLCLALKPLAKEIVPSKCTFRMKPNEAVVTLVKATSGKWYELLEKPSKFKPSEDKEEDPGKSLMKMMKQMYDDGDDEMKRTIGKAWQESQQKQMAGGAGPVDV